MKAFTVNLAKNYYCEEKDNTITVVGTIQVYANSQAEADAKVEEEMQGKGTKILQTIDPRIIWEKDYQDLADKGYSYDDFTFRVINAERGEDAYSS